MPLPLGENLGGGKVEDLTPRQLQVAELAARGLTYTEIGQSIVPPASTGTVRSHMHRIYSTLEISTKEQLGNIFSNSNVAGVDVGSLPISDLSGRELQIFEILASGITSSDAAKLMGLGTSTVRTHKVNIRKKLGLNNSSQLRSAASAYVAGKQNAQGDAAITVQTATTGWLSKIAEVADGHRIRIRRQTKLPVNNGQNYQRLAELGFVPRTDEDLPRVDLFGFVAVKAADDWSDVKQAFMDPRTVDIAETVIQNEVRVFLQEQPSV